MTTKTKTKSPRDWPEPKESGVVRDTTEYRWAVEELGQGREVSFKVQPIAKVKRPGEALCQALRRHIRSSGLPFRVYSRKGVIYIRKE